MMFQDARLLPWKTVQGHVALGLPGQDAQDRAGAALAAVALADRVLLMEDGGVTLDRCIALPRPRVPGAPDAARHVGEILGRVLQRPAV